MNEEQKKLYEEFIEYGRKSGFTQPQLDFMWNFIMMSMISIDKSRYKQ